MLIRMRDKTGDLEKKFKPIIAKYFPTLSHAKFLYSFRSEPDTDDEGQVIAASASRLSNRERDLYGFDFEINVYKDGWDEYSDLGKKRLAYHELSHCRVLFELNDNEEETDVPLKDGAGRIMIEIVEHDVLIKSFKAEIEKFGLPGGKGAETAWWLYRYVRKHKRETKSKLS